MKKQTPPPASPSEAWLNLQELLGPMTDAVAGHRARLEASGFSPTAAEMMSIDFHRALVMMTFKAPAP
jgi:hypothetical protein